MDFGSFKSQGLHYTPSGNTKPASPQCQRPSGIKKTEKTAQDVQLGLKRRVSDRLRTGKGDPAEQERFLDSLLGPIARTMLSPSRDDKDLVTAEYAKLQQAIIEVDKRCEDLKKQLRSPSSRPASRPSV